MKKRYYVVRYRISGQKDYYRGYILRPQNGPITPSMSTEKGNSLWFRKRETAERHLEKIRKIEGYGYGHEFVVEDEGGQPCKH